MNLTPSEQLMHSVAFITMLDSAQKTVGAATGFIFAFCATGETDVPCIVTNRHVLSHCAAVKIAITKRKAQGGPDIGNSVSFIAKTNQALFHPNSSIDLAILPIGSFIVDLVRKGQDLYFTKLAFDNIPKGNEWEQFSAVENVMMAGYPKGFRDSNNNLAIFRSGITATPLALDFQGKPQFLVDMPCFEGCSGSPVFICDEGLYADKRSGRVMIGNRFKLLGIQYAIPRNQVIGQLATVPTAGTTLAPVVQLYLNLGYVIKASELVVFESMIRAQLDTQTAAAGV